MSKQFYWAVVRNQTRMWPMQFHFRQHDARDDMHRMQRCDKKGKPIFRVERFLFEKKGDHYDIYKHKFKRL